MKNNTLSYSEKMSKIVFWGICFILFLPIIVLPPYFQPSVWSRTILFRSALALIACFFLFKYFYKNDISVSLPKWKLGDYLPFLALCGFILLIIISTIFSEDPRFSFFGSPTRGGGSLNLIFYFIFSALLAFFVKQETWKKLWTVNFIVASLASLLALIQASNFLTNIFVSYEGGGTPSFLGNSTFLAIYLLFMAIWAFTLFLEKRVKKLKVVYGGLFLMFLLVIFLTNSRATYLALIVAFLFFFFFYPLRNKKIKIAKIAVLFLVATVTAVIVLFNLFPQLGQQNAIFARLENRLSIERVAEDLFGTRFAVWQMTLQAIKDRPILGYGPENFYIGFEKYYEPTAPNMQKLWWDRPHNIFLDVAVNFGLIAFAFYAGFWIVLLLYLQKYKHNKKDSPDDAGKNKIIAAHGLQTMFIGYLIILFFNFDTFATYLISFFFIGYSFYLLFSEKEMIEIKNRQKIINYKNKKLFAGIFAIILVLFLFFWNIKPLYLNENIAHANNLSEIGSCGKAMETIENANKNPGILLVYSALTYSDIIKKCSTQEKESAYAKKGFEALKNASVAQPRYARTWLFMAGLTNVLAAREEDQAKKSVLLNEAREYLNKSLQLSPKRQETLIEMEKTYLIAEDYKSMEKTGHDCVNIDPSQGVCYWYLGVSEIFLGDQQSGKTHIEEALKKKGFVPSYVQLGAAYISQKNYADAADAYYLAVHENSPQNAGYHAVLATLYRQIGEYTKATQEAVEVFKLQPGDKESIDFIQALLGLSPNDPVMHGSMAYIYQQIGQEDKARQELLIAKNLYLQLIAKNADTADHHYNLAVVYRELQDYENSYKELLLYLKLAPEAEKKATIFAQGLPQKFWEEYVKSRK